MLDRTIGHYNILEKIGEGGMGVVYKARDTHLERLVAIKVLPPEAVADPERKRRFVQEARAASALNHANIIHIYDVSSDAGTDFIAMEYVPGKTLGQIIQRKGMRLSEVLKVAVQMADALACAHAAGIVHRDLKPSNVMVDDRGSVKVLDFGLAKLTEIVMSGENDTTRTLRAATEEGTVVGTAAYMSPEQAEGRKVDARSDVFSFGSLLYEMLAGRQAFHGESKIATLSAILHSEPAPLGEDVPLELERIIARCLRKEPDRRIQHMDDLKLALEELKEESSSSAKAHAPALRKQPRAKWYAAGALATLLAAAGLWWYYHREPSTASVSGPTMTRLTSDPGLTTEPTYWPDGKLVAYASDRAGDSLDIWVQQLSGGDPHRITSHPADDHEPHFSPDGTRIAFRSARDGGGIYVVPALGGPAQKVAAQGRQPRFSPDGKSIAYWVGQPSDRLQNARAGEAYVVPASGGEPRRLAAELSTARNPVWSPDGRNLLVAGVGGEPSRFDWWLVALDSGAATPTGAVEHLAKQKLTLPVPGQWLDGRVLFTADSGDSSNLWQADLAPAFRMAGPARRVTSSSGIDVSPASAGGRTVFASLTENVDVWELPINADTAKITGELRRLTQDLAPDIGAVVSGDGTKVAYCSRRAGNFVLLLLDLTTGKETTLVSLPPSAIGSLLNLIPGITVDGEQVAYWFKQDSGQATAVVPASGGAARTVCSSCQFRSWTNTGRKVIVSGYGLQSFTGALDIASGEFQPVLPSRMYPFAPKTSWDGRWLAFYIPVTGKTKVWIAPISSGPPPAEPEMISVTDGSTWDSNPNFSPDGSLLYFYSQRDGARCIWAQRLDPASKRPVGEAFAVYHLHSARRSPAYVRVGQGMLSLARNKLVFVMPERLGNVWIAE